MLWPTGHHDHVFPHLWCAAPPGAQEVRVGSASKRIFRPPYVGQSGWLGVRLDGRVPWDEIAMFCEDAYRTVAPPTLVRRLDEQIRSKAPWSRLISNPVRLSRPRW